jgi:predicted transcriptional regulator
VKPVKMLSSLRSGPKYATILSKEVDCTYSHTVKLLDLFKDYGLVDFDKKGRIKMVRLTEMGQDICGSVENLLMKLARVKEKSS